MKNKIFWVCICFWTIFTLLRVIFHQPWSDEANAWELVRNFHLGSIMDTIKYEGHFFVWYLILLPFAKLNFAYPYSMLLINWLFGFFTILTLWKYAPFNNFIKVAITFSFPFFAYYPIVARCYMVGIFLLFILCTMYKNKLKYPIIFSVLVFLCANTSLMACIGALFFGVILLFDLFKQKQYFDLKICSAIGFLCIITLLIQILNVQYAGVPSTKITGITKEIFLNPFVYFTPIVNAILLTIFTLGFGISLFKDKLVFSFLAITFGFLILFFQFCYCGDFWHWYFLYVYLICGCWIGFNREALTENMKKSTTIFLCIISILFIFDFKYEPRVFVSNSKILANFIKENKQAHFIYFDNVLNSTLPYLHDDNYSISYFQNKNRTKQTLVFEKVKNYIDLNKINYSIWANCDEIKEIKDKNGNKITFSLEKNLQNRYCIYKTEYVEKK